MEFKDYYAVLGVPRTASPAEVKKAFRKLARQHHPDAKPGDTAAERRFKEINEANEVLRDPAKRKQYDELGDNWEAVSRARASGAGGPAGFGGAGRNVRYEYRTTDDSGEFSDFFRVFFGEEAARAGEAPAGDRGSRAEGTRATGAMGFEDILAGMGIGNRPTGATGSSRGTAALPPATRPTTARPASSISMASGWRSRSPQAPTPGAASGSPGEAPAAAISSWPPVSCRTLGSSAVGRTSSGTFPSP